jgi:hypothetical protein
VQCSSSREIVTVVMITCGGITVVVVVVWLNSSVGDNSLVPVESQRAEDTTMMGMYVHYINRWGWTCSA